MEELRPWPRAPAPMMIIVILDAKVQAVYLQRLLGAHDAYPAKHGGAVGH